MSRRELGAALLAAPWAAPLATPMIAAGSKPQTIAVVGAGVFGAWTAYHLRTAGHRVMLFDQYGPASSRGSSGGETRIIRASYGPDEVYTKMAARSLGMWSGFFERTGHALLHRTGVLWMAQSGNEYVGQSRATLSKVGVRFEDLSHEDLLRRYPQIQILPGTVAIFEPESGALMARRATAVVVAEFVKAGGTYTHAQVRPPGKPGRVEQLATMAGETIQADAFVFAGGPWLGKVFPEVLGKRIFVTRQDVLFFGPEAGDKRFEPPQMPVWIDFSDDRGMYGFPDIETRGFKVAFDKHGPEFDPDHGTRVVPEDKVAEARVYLRDRFPALASAPLVDSRVCQYENTANGDFVIDRHPEMENVWLAGGGSGHGFKHGPAVGEYLAARITGLADPVLEPRFSVASKGTEQKRAVY